MGRKVCPVPGVYDDAYNKAIELRDKEGYTFIHPFDDEDVIAGQGTIGLEDLRISFLMLKLLSYQLVAVA